MTAFSVVIVCKDEASVIGSTLASLRGMTDDVLVYDSGSTDGTQDIVRAAGVRLIEGAWEGFGKTKSRANTQAKYDWILSLDADEAPDETLLGNLRNWQPGSEKEVLDLSFRNFIGAHALHYGEWGRDHHIRMFNRKWVNWDDAPVHENLVMPEDVVVKKIRGFVLHRTVRDLPDYVRKMQRYALLNADKYFRQGKRASWFKLRLSPGFTFFLYYVLKLGFLDGYPGYLCAKMTAWYTFLKYARLRELWENRLAG